MSIYSELGKIWEKAVMAYFKVELRKTMKQLCQDRGSPAEI
jgi:hypothetical protein